MSDTVCQSASWRAAGGRENQNERGRKRNGKREAGSGKREKGGEKPTHSPHTH